MRILIADDDATSRLLLAAAAAKQGHECLTAVDGSSAWEHLSTRRIDVLLTDWMMPGLDGPDLCRRVREELTEQYVYIVLITGLSNREQILEGMSAGADDYLIKPVDPFAVQTRLVAAARVTALHSQVVDFRNRLTQANFELLTHSLTDPLTGLGNRRRMDRDLTSAHAHAERVGTTYAIALFDIDHFKDYNDHYGHPAGDHVLREVANSLSSAVRAGENIYRYGGEEFLVLLTDSAPSDAVAAARRICRAVADADIPHRARPSMPPIVTLSGGVSFWRPASGRSLSDVLDQADQALLHAKSAGRNRVMSAPLVNPGEKALGSQLLPIGFDR